MCQMISERHVTIPARAKDVSICLNIQKGQCLNHSRVLFQPTRMFQDLGLSFEATPMVDLGSLSTYLLVQNNTKEFPQEVGFSESCISAGLYQMHDQDKRVAAYASETLQSP